MDKTTRAGEVEFIFETPFSAQELKYKDLKILPLADGKRYIEDIELGGSTLFVARVHRDGMPDEDFGPNGWRAEFLEMVGTNRRSGGLLSRAGGGVLAAMSSDTQFGLVCFNADGKLDTNFGQNGKIVHDFFQKTGDVEVGRATNPSDASQASRRAVGGLGAITPGEDGKFFGFLGALYNFPSTLMLFKPDGQLDPEFNGNGVVTISHPTLHAVAAGIVSTSDGGVVVVGRLANHPTSVGKSVFFCQYKRDGSLDEQFGESGFAVFDSESADIPESSLTQMDLNNVVKLADGGFAASGELRIGAPSWLSYGLVICVDSLGKPPESFNRAKPVLFGLLGAVEVTFRYGGIAEQADGKIVVGGGATIRDPALIRDMLLVRFHASGSVDSSFGGQGWVRMRPYEYVINYVESVVIDEDGKILVAAAGGHTNFGSDQRGYVVQFD